MALEIGADNAVLVSHDELENERTRDSEWEMRISDTLSGAKRFRPRKVPGPGNYTVSYMSSFFSSAHLSRYDGKNDLQRISEGESLAFASIYFDEEDDCVPDKVPKTACANVVKPSQQHSMSRSKRKIKAPASKAQEYRELQAALKASLQEIAPRADQRLDGWRSHTAMAFRQHQSLVQAH
mmetsp:Transcript_50875/g.102016  ORF Transcript_50875/g.102016 Transcript_50875/m.102016 type:complete len:181 (-) Transcript_50875:154-696(-)